MKIVQRLCKSPVGFFKKIIHPRRVKEENKGPEARPEKKRWPHHSPQVFSLHIPKTAGTSLRSQLTTRFDQDAILHIKGAASEQEELLQQVDDYGLVTGHLGYGLVKRFSRRPMVLTFLRDPIDRAVSAFYFHRRCRVFTNPAVQITAQRARELELPDFIRLEPKAAAYFLGNVQTALLQSNVLCRFFGQEQGPVSLEQACANLERCTCVGVTERMADSVTLMCATLGWEPFTGLHQANRTIHRPALESLDQKTLAVLGELTALDRALYRFAQELFEGRWQALLAGRLPSCALPTTPLFADNGEEAAAGGTVFTFERAIPGNGWYGREHDGHRWFCWTGPDCQAWIDLAPVPGGPALLLCHVVHTVKPKTLEHLQLLVNGQAVPGTVCPDIQGHLFTAAVPTALLALGGGRARITIRVPEVFCPAQLDPGSSDSRWLGVAVDRLELVPAS